MVQVIFIIFVAFIVVSVVITYIGNLKVPVVSTKARLIMKKRDVQTAVHVNGAITNSEVLILVFELYSGSQLKFNVKEDIFKRIPEYQWGALDYRGNHLFRFETSTNNNS